MAVLLSAILPLGSVVAEAFIELHGFKDGNHYPNALTEGADGALYGTAYQDSSAGLPGMAFRITAMGELTPLALFVGTNGAFPVGKLTQASNGDFYGATSFGGDYNQGTVFRMTSVGPLTTLASFSGPNGANPAAGLIEASDGNLYGTTLKGGNSDSGTLFRITPEGDFTLLVSFGLINGAYPSSPLTQGSDGSLYGTTRTGGASGGAGVLFRVALDGTYTNRLNQAGGTGGVLEITNSVFDGIVGDRIFRGQFVPPSSANVLSFPSPTFTGTNGEFVPARFAAGTNGLFYGTTSFGGAHNKGTVYQLNLNGLGYIVNLTNLLSFDGTNGACPETELLLASDGNFYGTTQYRGPGIPATIFRLTHEGVLTTIYRFTNSLGESPHAALVQGTNGNYFGTTYRGGANDEGTVFEISPTGSFTNVDAFEGTNNGAHPTSRLVQGTNGTFYGTTHNGGTHGYGTIFEMSAAGALTSLVSFNWTNGFGPRAGLIQGANGNFYGTTISGGAYGHGTLFEVTPTGTLTTLVSFDEDNGAEPFSEPIQANDGTLYLTTTRGGSGGGGNIARVGLEDFIITQITPSGGEVHLAWNSLPGQEYQVQYKADAARPAWTELTTMTATNSASFTVDPNPASSNRLYRVVLLQ